MLGIFATCWMVGGRQLTSCMGQILLITQLRPRDGFNAKRLPSCWLISMSIMDPINST